MSRLISSPNEAVFLACEMEKRAIRMYERMLLLFSTTENQAMLEALLKDERAHLKRFRSLLGDEPLMSEDRLLLEAEAAGILFRGGLTEAMRKGAVNTTQSLHQYAMEQERIACRTYQHFAEQCEGETGEALNAIALEESAHLDALKQMDV